MISRHTLDTESSGRALYDTSLDVTKAQFLDVVDTLTFNRAETCWACSLKNEPCTCSSGDAALD